MARRKICVCGGGTEMGKIVFVIPDMPGGGTERVVALLANEYSRRGIPTGILLFAGSERAYPLDPRIEVVSVGGRITISLVFKRLCDKNVKIKNYQSKYNMEI